MTRKKTGITPANMKPMRILIFIILTFVGVQLTQAAPDDNAAVWSSYVGTNRYDFAVSHAEIARTPIWQESDDQPPLPARKALRLARARLAKLFDDAKNWRLDTLSLSQVGGDGHWVYLVRFEPPLPPSGVLEGFQLNIAVPVLMSGVAVEPKISLWKDSHDAQ